MIFSVVPFFPHSIQKSVMFRQVISWACPRDKPPPLQNAWGATTIPCALKWKNIIVVRNHLKFLTRLQLTTTSAGFNFLRHCTLPNLTQGITERSFYAIHTAIFTINHFRQNFHLIQFWSFSSNFNPVAYISWIINDHIKFTNYFFVVRPPVGREFILILISSISMDLS